jgi:hypothetical protein
MSVSYHYKCCSSFYIYLHRTASLVRLLYIICLQCLSIHLLGLLSTTYVYRVSLSVLNILLCLSTVNSYSRTSPPPQLTLPLPPCTYWLYSSSRISLLPLLPTTHPISMVSHITLLSVRLIRLYCLILHHLSCSLPSSIHLGFSTHAHSWYLQ